MQRSLGPIVAHLAALRASPDCARLDEFQQAGLSAGRKEPSHARVYIAPCADANSGPHGGTRGLQPDAFKASESKICNGDRPGVLSSAARRL